MIALCDAFPSRTVQGHGPVAHRRRTLRCAGRLLRLRQAKRLLGQRVLSRPYALTQVADIGNESGPYDTSAWWVEPDLDDAEHQLRRALEISPNATSVSTLTTGQRCLQVNLVAAKFDVIRTAQRRINLVERLTVAPSADDLVVAARPHPLILAMVSLIYRCYEALTGRVRNQFNLSLIALRAGNGPQGRARLFPRTNLPVTTFTVHSPHLEQVVGRVTPSGQNV